MGISSSMVNSRFLITIGLSIRIRPHQSTLIILLCRHRTILAIIKKFCKRGIIICWDPMILEWINKTLKNFTIEHKTISLRTKGLLIILRLYITQDMSGNLATISSSLSHKLNRTPQRIVRESLSLCKMGTIQWVCLSKDKLP